MLAKPFSPRLDIADPINRGLTGWWAMSRAGNTVDNILLPTRTPRPVYTGTSIVNGAGRIGSVANSDGLTYIDLGSTYPMLPSDTTPFTFMWQEMIPANWNSSGLGGGALSGGEYRGVLNFLATGAGNRFYIFRHSGASIYGSLSFGRSTASAGIFVNNSALHLVNSVNIWRTWMITSSVGTLNALSANASSHQVIVDGTYYTTSGSGSFVAQTTAVNYLGWDGADNKSIGHADNWRMWARVLSKEEIRELMFDAWAGGRPRKVYRLTPPPAAVVRPVVFTAI